MGVGSDFFWTVKIGSRNLADQRLADSASLTSDPFHAPETSYNRPTINSIGSNRLLPNGKADDSAMIMISGDDFGQDGSIAEVFYGGDGADKYQATDCVMLVPHQVMNCSSTPGVGTEMKFSLRVNGLTADTFDSHLRYLASDRSERAVRTPAGTPWDPSNTP